MRVISRYAKIIPGAVDDGGKLTSIGSDVYAEFIREIYARWEISYPKFYKMDDMSKLAFAASEILLRGSDIKDRFAPVEIGVVLTAPHSSLETDCAHQALITGQYAPSPAVFVYTLANIMAGEICIRNGFKGENIVFANDSFMDEGILSYVNALFESGRVRACLCGEVDFFGKEFSSRFFLVEERTDGPHDVADTYTPMDFSSVNIRKVLYQ